MSRIERPTISQRISRFMERQGLLEGNAENNYFTLDSVDYDPMNQLLDPSITYCITIGPQVGRNVFSLQTLPADEPEAMLSDGLGKLSGFSLHAGSAVEADQRKKLERLVRNVTRPAISGKGLSLTSDEKVRYELKIPYRGCREGLIKKGYQTRTHTTTTSVRAEGTHDLRVCLSPAAGSAMIPLGCGQIQSSPISTRRSQWLNKQRR